MKLTTTSVTVAAPRARVFAALTDPDVLQRVIPGCEALTATGPDTYEATMRIGVAGMKGTYKGHAAISDKHPPDTLNLIFEGKGAPGFVRGTLAIVLSDDPAGTLISSEADVQVGGLIASVGSRLIDATARKLADDFFKQLTQVLSHDSSGASERPVGRDLR
jgi:carbon monoxide dehydrogenase subunit G